MRGAYGKPYGLSARVKINQVMFSIRTTLKGEDAACEALRKVRLRTRLSMRRNIPYARSSTAQNDWTRLTSSEFWSPFLFLTLLVLFLTLCRTSTLLLAVYWCGQCKAKFPGRQLVYVSRNWGFTPFPKDVFMAGRQMTQEGKIEWKGAEGIIKGDGVGTKFASKKSVRLSKMGIWHKSSGDNADRPSDAMRLNWCL
jgi:hypothetical protein